MASLELSEEDLAHIEQWYYSASGESATDRTEGMFDLLDRLGITATERDLYPSDPRDWIEVSAIKAYLQRHPEIDHD